MQDILEKAFTITGAESLYVSKKQNTPVLIKRDDGSVIVIAPRTTK